MSVDDKHELTSRVIAATLLLAVVASFVLAGTWSVSWDGHSIPLMIGIFVAGVAGCSSVVTVYPFAAPYSPVATSALSAGMGLNGLVAAVVSIIQVWRGYGRGNAVNANETGPELA
jgi:hypothetical protein